ncbi:MAG: type III glutamate--ammonia ligase [Verrucomicrobiales bacterium]|nr:type III glutamate--ammonia ligase [Verrucomicrobiales bacterium]
MITAPSNSSKPTFAIPEDFEVDQTQLAAVKAKIEKEGIDYLLSTYVDIHGAPKAKVTPSDALAQMARGSELYTVGAMEGMGLIGPHEDECAAVPDLDTMIICPWDRRFAYFFGDLYHHGDVYPNDSRQVLKRQMNRAASLGYTFNLGVEPEFYVFREDPETGERTGLSPHRYRGLCPAYDVAQTFSSMDFLEPFSRHIRDLGWGLYSFDQEGGHSQYEFDFDYSDALTMSDRLVFLRLMAKKVAESAGCIATFMPKPFADDFRSGCHFNMSLQDNTTESNAFAPEPEGNAFIEKYGIPMSKNAYHFAAGVLKHAAAITAVTSPTYNSYQGFISQGEMLDVSWAPVLAAYGRNNRSAMMRMPLNRYCLENRAPDMSVNPYLAAAFHLAAGLEGIEQELDPGEPINTDLYQKTKREIRQSGIDFLPSTLCHAIEYFEEDELAGEVFGEMKDIFISQKTTEWERDFYTIHKDQHDRMMTFL